MQSTIQSLVDVVANSQEKIHQWLESYEGANELPLYSSVDIRDAGFKMAVVDTNLFPAGFNNLCEHGLADAVSLFQNAIKQRVPSCKNILIIAEEHTRNTWYLENIRILQELIEKAGFNTTIATFLSVQPAFCENALSVELETATQKKVRIHCFKNILNKIKNNGYHYELVILNNDLTTGVPELLQNMNTPIYPSIKAGWHSRLKSHHFRHADEIIPEFASMMSIDPWFLSALFTDIGGIDINDDAGRQQLADAASDLLNQIKSKYHEHDIQEKPYLILKSDSGTYGMGVLAIEDPNDILELNRKARNKMHKGKSAQVINRFLIQEGIPTIHTVDNLVSEVCLYQINNTPVGGFYRSHSNKSARDNLNSQGMTFQQMCPHSQKYGACGIHHDVNIFDIYRIIARIAGIAAHREIIQLEKA